MSFPHWLKQHRKILTEGAVVERLRRGNGPGLDPEIDHAHWVLDPAGKQALTEIYSSYTNVSIETGCPMIFFTPTWHASPARVRKAGYELEEINRNGVAFMRELLNRLTPDPHRFMLGGLTGVRHDSYRPEEALGENEAYDYHKPQAEILARAGVDFLMAATLPSRSESLGIARVFSETGTPYIPSFIVRPEGGLLDGTPLLQIIRELDAFDVPPVGYLVNCVHPANLWSALQAEGEMFLPFRTRLLGLQANTSTCNPLELDGSDHLHSQEAETFAEQMIELQQALDLKILGGCCGTDEKHIRAVAEKWRQIA